VSFNTSSSKIGFQPENSLSRCKTQLSKSNASKTTKKPCLYETGFSTKLIKQPVEKRVEEKKKRLVEERSALRKGEKRKSKNGRGKTAR